MEHIEISKYLREKREEAIEEPIFMNMWSYLIAKFELLKGNGTAYHYTDINGFNGILADNCFWVSNVHFMNDSKEYYEGLSKCNDILDKLIETETDSNTNSFYLGLKADINSKYSSACDAPLSQSDIFSISFCGDGDLLSQWRGYGNNGGISIGFDILTLLGTRFKEISLYEKSAHLKYPEDEIGIILSQVIYNDEDKREILEEVLSIGKEHLDKTTDKGIALLSSVRGTSSSLFSLFPMLKSNGFSEEKELRFIYQATINKKFHVSFRERNGILLPYIKFKMLDCNCQPLRELPIIDIVVGPANNQELKINSIKYFLENSGHSYLCDKVRPSSISYRNNS